MLAAASIEALRRIADRANDVLGANASGAFPLRGDVRAPAQPQHVADPLSVAAPPGGWFVTIDARGGSIYTRAGTFHLDESGALRGADGYAVLGFTGIDGAAVPGPIRLPEPDRTLGRCDDVRIESDGTLSYTRTAIDPRTRERSAERVVVAQVALARFPAGTEPARLDSAHVSAPDGVLPHIGRASDGTFGPLTTYARDTGGLDLDAGLARLSEAYLSFRALHAAQHAEMGTDKVALDLVK